MLKIYIESQILEFENDRSEIDNIVNEIDDMVSKTSKVLSHIVIDDFEIYENYYDYFLDNIRVIEKVEVVLVTYRELADDILISTMYYIERIPNKVEELANRFYKNPDKQAWDDLTDFLGGITWIMDTFTSIDQDIRLKDVVSSYESWNLYAKEVFSLKEILSDLEVALSNNDNVSIGDILLHEIIPIFNEMKKKLLELIKMEETLDDLN